MKTHAQLIIALVLIALTACGCDGTDFLNDPHKKRKDERIVVTPVSDPQLAKLILKPKKIEVTAARDPFRPIKNWSAKRDESKMIEPIKEQFSDLAFIGMVKMDNQAIALVRTADKKVMLKLNQQYRDYIVKDITQDYVIFSNGETQITLKRGAKK